jgi:4-amino-4-deoxy-L-arabinose transferase-like glycosyltransferase
MLAAALYSRPPIPIDETRYLSVAWEMWQRQDFLVPHINGLVYSQKPPLLFWLIHLSWLFFGLHELPARLVGPVCGLVAILLTIRLARKLWPERKDVAGNTPFILLGITVWSLFSSLTMFDALLTAIVLFCLSCIHAAGQNCERRRPWLLLGLGIGLGLLAKGPVILLYVLPTLLLAPAWSANNPRWGHWYLYSLLAALLGVAVALCWALPAAYRGGPDYARAIFFSQTAGRMINAFAHNRPVYWYLLIAPLLLFPWIFWLPTWTSAKRIWREQAVRFCLAVILPAWLLFSLVSGKQIHYLLPTLPFIALLLARAVDNTPVFTRQRYVLIFVLFVLGAVLLLIPHLSWQDGDREILPLLPGWLPMVFWLDAGLLLLSVKSRAAEIRLIASTMATLFIGLHLALTTPLNQLYNLRETGKSLSLLSAEASPIAVFPAELADQFQFAGKLHQPIYPTSSLDQMKQWGKSHPDGYCLIFTKEKTLISPQQRLATNPYKGGWLILAPVSIL